MFLILCPQDSKSTKEIENANHWSKRFKALFALILVELHNEREKKRKKRKQVDFAKFNAKK